MNEPISPLAYLDGVSPCDSCGAEWVVLKNNTKSMAHSADCVMVMVDEATDFPILMEEQ